jgi:hypothetical protein
MTFFYACHPIPEYAESLLDFFEIRRPKSKRRYQSFAPDESKVEPFETENILVKKHKK